MIEESAPLRIGWFSTGRGSGSRGLLAAACDRIASGRLNAEIAVVFCNRAAGEDPNTDMFLDQVGGYGLPLVTISSRDFRRARGEKAVRKGEMMPAWRREYDREVMRALEPYSFDVGILAGYMLIFCEEAAARWDLLNLHPAEPGGPKGIWQDVIWELIENRRDRAGAMIHLATAELDAGPPGSFCTYSIAGTDLDHLWQRIGDRSGTDIKSTEGEDNALFQEIRRRGLVREIPLVIETLGAFADKRLKIQEKTICDARNVPTPPLDLTGAVEEIVATQARKQIV
jgi:folate-dependent phosphoribosylglycinamide formyltransferase PurN